jgi:Protein of unknown function (DUF3072)
LTGKAEITMSNPKTTSASNTEKDPDDWVSGDEPMTGAQASYLQTLAEQAHEQVETEHLTKAEASKLIDSLRKKAGVA